MSTRTQRTLLRSGFVLVGAVLGVVGGTAVIFYGAKNGIAALEERVKRQINLTVSSIDQKFDQFRKDMVPSSTLNACELRTHHRSNSSGVPFQPILISFWNSTAAADLCLEPVEPSFLDMAREKASPYLTDYWLQYFPPPAEPPTPKSSVETASVLIHWFWMDYVPNVYLKSVYFRLFEWITKDVFPRLEEWTKTNATTTMTTFDLQTFNWLLDSSVKLFGNLFDYTTIPVDGEPHGTPKAAPLFSFQDMHTAWQRGVSIVFAPGRFIWPSVAMSQNPLRIVSWVWWQTAGASFCAPTSSRITERIGGILHGTMEGIRHAVLCVHHFTVNVVGGTATSAVTSVRKFVSSITERITGLASPIRLWKTVFGDDAASSDQPDAASSDQPDAASDQPVAASDQPDAALDQPDAASDQPDDASDQPPKKGTFALLPGWWPVIQTFATSVWWLLSSAGQVIFGSAGLAVAVLFMFPFLVLGFFLLRWFFMASIRNITGFVQICFRVTVIFILFIGWLCLPKAWKVSIRPLLPLLLVSGAAAFFWIRGSMVGDMRNDVYNMLRRESHRKYDSVQLRNEIVGRKYENALVHWFAKAWVWPVVHRDVQADHRVKKSREGFFATTEKWQWDRNARPSGTFWKLIKRLRGRYEWEQPMAGN